MHHDKHLGDAAEPLLAIDRKVREWVMPYRKSRPVKALSWISDLGDQPQMRFLAGGMLALGILRTDRRMTQAGVRMLIAHETATLAKTWIKDRIIRSRPNSAATHEEQKLRKGHDTSKEKSSFPSGHSAGIMATALAFSAEYPEHRSLALTTAGTVALAQIPRCAHYPSDVAAGLMIGTAAKVGVGRFWRWTAALFSRSRGGRF